MALEFDSRVAAKNLIARAKAAAGKYWVSCEVAGCGYGDWSSKMHAWPEPKPYRMCPRCAKKAVETSK